MAFHIRRAKAQDAAALLKIYAPYVQDTTVTFEFDVPSEDEFAERIEHALASNTWLVLEHVEDADGAALREVNGCTETGSGSAQANGAASDDAGAGAVAGTAASGTAGNAMAGDAAGAATAKGDLLPRPIGYAYYGPLGKRAAYQWSAETSIYLDMAWCDRGLGAFLLEVLEECMAAQGICTSEACITSENAGSMEFHRRHGYTECARFDRCANKFNRWLSTIWMEKQLAPYKDNPSPVSSLDEGALDAILAQANERLRLRKF